MRKKYEKVDLKSDAFKIKKTPQKNGAQTSRSPASKSPGFMTSPSAQKIDPNELFQKVCCPNCKYLFKIIKNNELLTQSLQKKKQQKKNASAQTQQQLLPDIRIMAKMSAQINEKLASKFTDSLIFKTRLIKQNITQSMAKPNDAQSQMHVKSQGYQFQQRSPFRKSRQLQLHSVRDQREPPKSPTVLSKKLSDLSILSKKPLDVKANQEARLYKKEQIEATFKRQLRVQLGDELQQVLLQNIKNQRVLDYISEFYSELPTGVQKPGYAKMLLREGEVSDQLIYFS